MRLLHACADDYLVRSSLLSRDTSMHSKSLRILFLFVLTGLLRGEGVTLPPEPDYPKVRELPREKVKAAVDEWHKDYRAWESSLTPEQKAEKQRRDEELSRLRKEEHKRAGRLPLPTDGYSWRKAAEKGKLAPTTIEQLARDKIAYGPSVKQSFDPYLGGPVFITSDSLLNGFHVLFETTFRGYEVRQCSELRQNLEAVIRQARKNLQGSRFTAAELALGWRQAQIVVGPALCLLGASSDLFDAEVRPEIEAQVDKIRAAKAVELPEWLAPATLLVPSIDYRACKPVGIYAESVQLADYFRAVRWLQSVPFRADRDVELCAIGLLGYGVNEARQSGAGNYFRAYSAVLGPIDGAGLPEAAHRFQNFLLAPPKTTWEEFLKEKKRGLLNQTATPPDNDSAELAKIQFRVLPPYRLPDSALFQSLANQQIEPKGLAVAAMLGSRFAQAHLESATAAQVGAALAEIKPAASGGERSLYDDYLDTLRTLFLEPPSAAPAFLRSEAWQAKSTQTALSGWAQMRHTVTLQAVRSEFYLGITLVPPGFVEPNPEFFSRLADLIERTRKIFNGDRDRWDELASLARKLEALAQKELRQEAWNASDDEFLKAYGERLAFVMGYKGNSYENPSDDAPRWAEVHHTQSSDELLAVAVGRPRLLFVLYPSNGMEILCRGSVMPYYEYRAKTRLTDAEWKAVLDSAEAPLAPQWMLSPSKD
jgi:hypothetical protein